MKTRGCGCRKFLPWKGFFLQISTCACNHFGPHSLWWFKRLRPCRKIRTENGKYKRNIWTMQTQIQGENRYETPQNSVPDPRSRYGPKKVGTRQKSVRSLGQRPTRKKKQEEKAGTRQERKSGTRGQKSAQTGKPKIREIIFVLNICVYFMIICMEHLQGPQMQSPQSWFQPP